MTKIIQTLTPLFGPIIRGAAPTEIDLLVESDLDGHQIREKVQIEIDPSESVIDFLNRCGSHAAVEIERPLLIRREEASARRGAKFEAEQQRAAEERDREIKANQVEEARRLLR